MTDNHLMFLVTLPIHYGSNESSGTSIQQGTSEKHIFFDLSAIFARKLQKSHLKHVSMSIWKLSSLFIKGCEGLLKNIHNLSIENKQYGHKCLSCMQITAASHKKNIYSDDFSSNISLFAILFSKFAPEFNKLKNG